MEKTYKARYSKIKIKNIEFKISYSEIGLDVYYNKFNKEGVFILSISTKINKQEIYLLMITKELSKKDYKDGLKILTSEAKEELDKYRIMLSIDVNYKLHNNHPLLLGKVIYNNITF